MTDILNGAWWCNYCTHKICLEPIPKCEMDVPYYASSPHCMYFSEDPNQEPLQLKE